MFQPSEERHPSGALALVNDPELAVGVRAAIAVHVHPELPWGGVGIEPGAVNAAADAVHIVIKGRAGMPPTRIRPPIPCWRWPTWWSG